MSNLSCETFHIRRYRHMASRCGCIEWFESFLVETLVTCNGHLFVFFLLALVKLSYNHYEKNLINETSDFRTEKQTNKQTTNYNGVPEMH